MGNSLFFLSSHKDLNDNEGINSGNYQSMLTGYWVHWVYWFYHVADISDLLALKENPLCV